MRFFIGLLILIGGILNVGLVNAADDGYKIKAKIKGVNEGECYLAYHFGEKQFMKDTAQVDKKGYITFEGEEKLEGGIYLFVLPEKKKYFELVVNEQEIELETDTANLVMNMNIKKSEENKLFYGLMHKNQPFVEKEKQLADEIKVLKTDTSGNQDKAIERLQKELKKVRKKNVDSRADFIEQHPESFYVKLLKASIVPSLDDPEKAKADSTYSYRYYLTHFFDNIDFADERILRTPIFNQKLNLYLDKYNYPMPDSMHRAADYLLEQSSANEKVYQYTAIQLINRFAKSKIMGYDAIYVDLVDEIYASGKATWANEEQVKKMTDRAKAMRPTLIGQNAPNIIITDSLGVVHNMRQIEAQITILYFWDPKCGHCKKYTPKLIDIYEKYKDEDIKIFSVCTATDRKKWHKAAKEYGFPWQDLIDEKNRSNFRYRYDITSTPRILILDKDKKIIAKKFKADYLEKFLEKEFGKK